MIIDIHALSVNEAYTGRRFSTKKLKQYKRDLMLILPNLTIPKGRLELIIQVGFSNSGKDLDNALKPFVDVLQKNTALMTTKYIIMMY